MVRLALIVLALCSLLLCSPTPTSSAADYPGGPWGGLWMPYFEAIHVSGDCYAFVGTVEYGDPSTLWVEITGVAGYHVGPVYDDGSFVIMVEVPPGTEGEVEAQAFSIFAQFSNRCYDYIDH